MANENNVKGRSVVISFKINVASLKRIDMLVRKGYFKNKSDLIRLAIESKVAKEKTAGLQ
ncbi:MAG: hypothetical protein DRO10_00055 [Thermoprotei archaeon]|nr:MAG: hypothetical protein DRO10_00055 [Thermoprotei archaeon]